MDRSQRLREKYTWHSEENNFKISRHPDSYRDGAFKSRLSRKCRDEAGKLASWFLALKVLKPDL